MKVSFALGIALAGALGASPVLAELHLPFGSGYAPPQSCTAWYDGCNMCEIEPDGSTSCTDKVCAMPGKGFCRAYEATSTEPG